MSAKMWEVTIDHARTCVLDPGLLLYCPPGSQQKTGVVFNIVGQVMGLLSDCQYAPIAKLSETEKASFSSCSHLSFLFCNFCWVFLVPYFLYNLVCSLYPG